MGLPVLDIAQLATGVIGIVQDMRKDNITRAKNRQTELFSQALIDVQENAIKSKTSFDMYNIQMNENIALGSYASSLSKSRIGVAGTTNAGLQSISHRYDMQRSSTLLMEAEQIAKLQLNKLSSKLTYNANMHKSPLDRMKSTVNDIATGVAKGINSLVPFVNLNEQGIFPDIARQDAFERGSFRIT